MKARPRSVEREVAEELNRFFTLWGMSPVERIPVLGRTGPDISINEMGLVIDVKSRLEVPKGIFFPISIPYTFDGLTAVRLKNFDQLPCHEHPAPVDYSSKAIQDWLAHMDVWRRECEPSGVAVVILHRPKMPIGESVCVIYSNCRRRLNDNHRNHNQHLNRSNQ